MKWIKQLSRLTACTRKGETTEINSVVGFFNSIRVCPCQSFTTSLRVNWMIGQRIFQNAHSQSGYKNLLSLHLKQQKRRREWILIIFIIGNLRCITSLGYLWYWWKMRFLMAFLLKLKFCINICLIEWIFRIKITG